MVVLLYRAPNSDSKLFYKDYKQLINTLSKEPNRQIIIGMDHNYDLLKSCKHSQTKDFVDFNLDHDLWPVITKLTHITKSTATLIDNIFVSSEIYSTNQSGIIVEDLSDHLPCLLNAHNLKLKKKEIPVITSRKITPKTIKEIQNKLSELDLANLVSHDKLDDCFDNFHQLVTFTIDSIAPYESYVPGKQMYRKEPWLPVSLLKSIKKQKYLYTKTLQDRTNISNHTKYKSYRNELTKLKQHCKQDYFHSNL